MALAFDANTRACTVSFCFIALGLEVYNLSLKSRPQPAPSSYVLSKNASIHKMSFSFLAIQAAKVSRNEGSSNEE